MFKRHSIPLVVALVAALASLVAGTDAALRAAPQHPDQAPGFYRLKVGDLEVTALFDGTGVFDPHWLNGTKTTMDGVQQASNSSSSMWVPAPGGVGQHSGAWWGASAAQATGRKTSTSCWSRTSIPITSAV